MTCAIPWNERVTQLADFRNAAGRFPHGNVDSESHLYGFVQYTILVIEVDPGPCWAVLRVRILLFCQNFQIDVYPCVTQLSGELALPIVGKTSVWNVEHASHISGFRNICGM